MEHTAKLNYLRIAPRKTALVAGLLRGLSVNEAEARLLLDRHRAAKPILKLLRSAISGARQKNMKTDILYISAVRVDQGPMLKRYMARAQGRGAMIQKKMSHVILVLSEDASKAGRGTRFTIPEKRKKKTSEAVPKPSRKRISAKKEPAIEKAEKKEQRGFLKRTFGRKTGQEG